MEEEWRSIPSAPVYEVSDLGRVRTIRSGRIRKQVPDKRGGYLNLMFVLGVEKKRVLRKVHHLVLEAFVCPKPPGLRTRHLDGDVTNNRLKNLKWGTSKENEADKVLHGTSQHGERNAQAKLTDTQASEIRRSKARGCDLAIRYGVRESTTISRIRNGVRRGV